VSLVGKTGKSMAGETFVERTFELDLRGTPLCLLARADEWGLAWRK